MIFYSKTKLRKLIRIKKVKHSFSAMKHLV